MGIGMVSHQRCMSHVGARPTTLLRAVWEQAALCVLTFDAPAFQWSFCKGGPSDQWSMEDCAVAQTKIIYCCAHKDCQLSLIPASLVRGRFTRLKLKLTPWRVESLWTGMALYMFWVTSVLMFHWPLFSWVKLFLFSWLCYLCYCTILSYNFSFPFLFIRFGDKPLLSYFGVLENTFSMNVIILFIELMKNCTCISKASVLSIPCLINPLFIAVYMFPMENVLIVELRVWEYVFANIVIKVLTFAWNVKSGFKTVCFRCWVRVFHYIRTVLTMFVVCYFCSCENSECCGSGGGVCTKWVWPPKNIYPP